MMQLQFRKKRDILTQSCKNCQIFFGLEVIFELFSSSFAAIHRKRSWAHFLSKTETFVFVFQLFLFCGVPRRDASCQKLFKLMTGTPNFEPLPISNHTSELGHFNCFEFRATIEIEAASAQCFHLTEKVV